MVGLDCGGREFSGMAESLEMAMLYFSVAWGGGREFSGMAESLEMAMLYFSVAWGDSV